MIWIGVALGLGIAAILVLGVVLALSFRSESDDAPAPETVPPSPGDDPEGFETHPHLEEIWISPEAREGLGWPPEPPGART